MSATRKNYDDFETVTTREAEGYSLGLVSKDKSAASASIFVNDEILSDLIAKFGSQDKAFYFLKGLLVDQVMPE